MSISMGYNILAFCTYSPIKKSQPSHILVYDLTGVNTIDVISFINCEMDVILIIAYIIQETTIGSRTKIGVDTVDTMLARLYFAQYSR